VCRIGTEEFEQRFLRSLKRENDVEFAIDHQDRRADSTDEIEGFSFGRVALRGRQISW
jgi:hypothetical protein